MTAARRAGASAVGRNIADDRNTSRTDRVYAPGDRPGPGHGWGSTVMQTARPRDFGALALVIAVFLVLLIVSIALGSPAVR